MEQMVVPRDLLFRNTSDENGTNTNDANNCLDKILERNIKEGALIESLCAMKLNPISLSDSESTVNRCSEIGRRRI